MVLNIHSENITERRKNFSMRKTVYNKIVEEGDIDRVNKRNIALKNDFLYYLASVDKSPQTIKQYGNDINIFFVWNLKNNRNRFFVDIRKKEFVNFQGYCINTLGWSPKRIKRVKSCISSMSNYIENMLDDEYPNYRNVICKIESPTNTPVRDKTILTVSDVDRVLRFLTEMAEYEKACAIAIAAFSGMRKSELLQMKMSYFDDDHLEFDGALYKTDRIRTKGHGKKGKLVPKFVLAQVKPYIDNWREERKRLGIRNDDMFVTQGVGDNKTNKWRRRSSLDQWTKQFTRLFGKPFYFHSLRHYCCTMLAEANIPSDIIKDFFQWESIEMISIYNDIDATSKFGNYFSKDGIVKQEEGNVGMLNKR